MATEISIDNIEDNIKERLDLKIAELVESDLLCDGDIEVELLPETALAFKRPVQKKGRISICYMDTEYDRTKSPEVVAQDGYNKFAFFCVSKNRRGKAGVNDMIRIVLKYLIGYKPLGHEKLIAKKVELFMREPDTNLWMARVELSAKYMLIEFNDDPPAAAITEMKFDPPVHGGAQVLVNEDTVPSSEPPYHIN